MKLLISVAILTTVAIFSYFWISAHPVEAPSENSIVN